MLMEDLTLGVGLMRLTSLLSASQFLHYSLPLSIVPMLTAEGVM